MTESVYRGRNHAEYIDNNSHLTSVDSFFLNLTSLISNLKITNDNRHTIRWWEDISKQMRLISLISLGINVTTVLLPILHSLYNMNTVKWS